ncbi:MAG: hypothetical protein DWQ05_02150 [Calditrichaeota bacterium]|nr:MAG: hypothetical protein DWQ05_02150 [Calditrichota bacterium]
MIFLISAILFSTFNHLLFKAFARLKIDLLTAIVANYAVCVTIGFIASNGTAFQSDLFAQNWFPFSVVQGGLLVVSLFLIGKTTAKHGVAITSLATRLSVAIPTVIAFFLYNDVATPVKIIGICAALLALYISGLESNSTAREPHGVKILPIILFISFGTHSALLKYVEAAFLGSTSYHTYVMAAFLSAMAISSLVLLWRIFSQKKRSRLKDVGFGCILGFSNYWAVYLLIRALSVPGWQSSELFPTISIAVVILSSFGAWAIFKERIHRPMAVAIGIGMGSLILINL